MPVLSIGDLANTFLIRRQSAGLKAHLTRLGSELTSGQAQDLGKALAGEFGPFAAIERSLKAVAAYKTANTEAAGLLTAAQTALGNIYDMEQGLGPALLMAGNARDLTLIRATSEDARQKFAAVVSSLNVRVADRTIFGGAATDRPPLASSDAIIAELLTAVAGNTTAADVIAAVNTWFDTPGGGFDSLGYLGSDSDRAPLAISDGETVAVSLRADNSEIRATLKSFALAGLVSQGVLDNDVDEQAALMAGAGGEMLTSGGALTTLRSQIGAVEARIETAQARNAAEAAAYEIARTELIGVDPYQTATELETVYAQIETLYTVTARIAGLTFTDFMK